MPAKKKTSKRVPGKPRERKSKAKAKAASVQPKVGAGRPAFEPSDQQRKQVETMVGLGLTHEEICTLIYWPDGESIAKSTLQKYFPDELERGVPKAKLRVGMSLMRRAMSPRDPGAVTAAIWLEKTRFGYSERQTLEVNTNSGVLVAPAAMTPAEWMEKERQANENRSNPIELDPRRN